MLQPLFVGLAPGALTLAGCSDRPGPSMRFNGAGSNTSITATAHGHTGETAINVPGFHGTLHLPQGPSRCQ